MNYTNIDLPKISVITVCYNSDKTILKTMKSFNSQDYQNKEYIIVDGGSQDNTLKIIGDSGINYECLISEKDNGIYDAINKGISYASGDLIGFLHSDDFFAAKDCLTKIAKCYCTNKTHGIYGDLEYISSKKPEKIIRRWKSGKFKKHKFNIGWMPPHPTLYIEKSAYIKYGVYNLNYKIASDYELILRFFWSNSLKLSYIPETLVKMRIGGASNKNIKNIFQKTKEDIQAMRNNNLGIFPAIFLKNILKLRQFLR